MKFKQLRNKTLSINLNPNWLSLLGCVLVVLKVTDVIGLSWWFVLLPFYLGLAIVAAFLAAVGVGFGLIFGTAYVADQVSRLKVKYDRKFGKYSK